MTTRIKVPKLGMAMVEATLAAWLVDDGAAVSVGEPICTIESDKTEHEIESPVSGILTRVAEVGAVYQVGEYLAEVS